MQIKLGKYDSRKDTTIQKADNSGCYMAPSGANNKTEQCLCKHDAPLGQLTIGLNPWISLRSGEWLWPEKNLKTRSIRPKRLSTFYF
jgi:hypothetical protein